ncbi:signal peptidase I [uncultured Neglectibacter sp.]|uniref:signal peptidase I n=1 Tax=uncultured Neglectibacter sp. TaxID=1924108 RepID=UPI0034DEC3BA
MREISAIRAYTERHGLEKGIAMRVMIRVLRGILTALLCIVLVLNLWLLVQQSVLHLEAPQVFGYSHYIVTTGSMEPSLSPGDLILVKAQDEYKLGDVVTFHDSQGATVTHRIMGTVSGQFITQGDANNTEDGDLLSPEKIVGKLQLVLPGAGSVIEFLRSPFGILTLLVIGVLLIKLPDWIGAGKNRGKRYKEE